MQIHFPEVTQINDVSGSDNIIGLYMSDDTGSWDAETAYRSSRSWLN